MAVKREKAKQQQQHGWRDFPAPCPPALRVQRAAVMRTEPGGCGEKSFLEAESPVWPRSRGSEAEQQTLPARGCLLSRSPPPGQQGEGRPGQCQRGRACRDPWNFRYKGHCHCDFVCFAGVRIHSFLPDVLSVRTGVPSDGRCRWSDLLQAGQGVFCCRGATPALGAARAGVDWDSFGASGFGT